MINISGPTSTLVSKLVTKKPQRLSVLARRKSSSIGSKTTVFTFSSSNFQCRN